MYKVDAVNLLARKVDTLARHFDWLGTSYYGSSLDMMYEVGALCEICGIQGHTTIECHTFFQGIEHANIIQNFNPRPQNKPYSNSYNPGWRNHLKFSYPNNNPMPSNAP